MWRREKAISGQQTSVGGGSFVCVCERQRECVSCGVRIGCFGGLKERKAEESDTDREKMFNLARHSTETLNLLQFLQKVKEGWQRVCGVSWPGGEITNFPQMTTEILVGVCC